MTERRRTSVWKPSSLDYTISDDREDVDIAATHAFLTESYWSKDIPMDVVERSIQNSHCFTLLDGSKRQVGFARVISDHATFAYVADVYVLEPHRGQGLAGWLMTCIMEHPDLQGLKRWILATRDLHGLYKKFGFDGIAEPEKLMEFRPERGY